MQYNDSQILYDQANVNYEGMWSITINETATFSESFLSIIRLIFSEIISIIDTTPIYSRYDESSIQYDEPTATYENYIEADASLKKIGTIISDISTLTESISRRIGIVISEAISITELFYSRIRLIFSEIATATESFASYTRIALSEAFSLAENIAKSIAVSFSEIISITEIISRRIGITISEVSTITETLTNTFRLIIFETATITESLVQNIFERLRGVIGMIKEFVRIGDKKEKVSLINVGEGVKEQLNVVEKQYDDSVVLYDQSSVCYNNYISSEKPIFKLGKKYNNVSVSLQKDKPGISKK
jgi:hypothetical protein